MTELLHGHDPRIMSMRNISKSGCLACPHAVQQIGPSYCGAKCEIEATERGFSHPEGYYLYDPVLYAAWRLKQ